MCKQRNSTFHMIENNGEISDALRYLMDAHNWSVYTHIDYDQFLSAPNIKTSDILVINLNLNDSHVFRFADKLLKAENRPGVLMTCSEPSPFLTTDIFATSRIEVLSQPFTANEFKASVDRLKNQIYPINE